MKRKALHIILSAIVLVVGPNVSAEINRGDEDKKFKKEYSAEIREDLDMDMELKLEEWMTEMKEFGTGFYEEELVLESWMLNEGSFADEAPEKNMELQNWMMKTFRINELENTMELEKWMVNPFITDNMKTFAEEEFDLENWMLSF